MKNLFIILVIFFSFSSLLQGQSIKIENCNSFLSITYKDATQTFDKYYLITKDIIVSFLIVDKNELVINTNELVYGDIEKAKAGIDGGVALLQKTTKLSYKFTIQEAEREFIINTLKNIFAGKP